MRAFADAQTMATSLWSASSCPQFQQALQGGDLVLKVGRQATSFLEFMTTLV
jgi:hypothetical protein